MTEQAYPEIPNRQRFTIGEACDLCGIKPHVLRYWEKRYQPLRKVERRGNRRYYSVDLILTIRAIKDMQAAGYNYKAIAKSLVQGKQPGQMPSHAVDMDKIRAGIQSVLKTLE